MSTFDERSESAERVDAASVIEAGTIAKGVIADLTTE